MARLASTTCPAQRNAFIRAGTTGDARYQPYKGRENTLLPAGLVGPVCLTELPATALLPR